ncbi:MAG TPA: M48 family metallopeptidase [Thermoanaerobaculia bacterium]|nr:M48 family metallopeptidase [Thermoanaerobaculia bacterium]
MRRAFLWILAGLALALAAPAGAQTVPAPARPAAASAAAAPQAFDPEAATEAWLARLTPEQRERSDSYFEGNYWLILWDYLYGLGVAGLLLATGLSARLRDRLERLTRFRFLRTFLYFALYIVLTAVLTFPLTVYESYVREHRYGLLTQAFGPWMGEQLLGLALAVGIGGLALTGIYAVLRRSPRNWWIWGWVVAFVFLVIGLLLAPVFLSPLFNRYTELRDPVLRGPILTLARANGIPTEHVYVYDASKQSNRVSANVSGLGSTLRISLNDNLLKRCSPAAVKAVMGHEMGHYVLNHIYEMIVEFGLVFFLGCAFLRLTFGRVAARWGGRWGIRGVDDPAGLPLMVILLTTYFFLMTPVINTIIRTNEAEADIFGLNAAREPDGFAEAALLLGEYRKLAPGPWEERLMFDHPSGRNRILTAMRWKAAQGAQGRDQSRVGPD